jgi:hypothetical protein
MKPIAILLYNRPYVCFDAMPLSLETSIAFLGWPSKFNEYEEINVNDIKDNFKKYFADYNDCSDLSRNNIRKSKKTTRILNLVRDAIPRSIVVVPRQKKGCVYLGRVKNFELFDSPEWLEREEFKTMDLIPGRSKKHLEVDDHPPAIEVAQGWNVENWEEVPLALLPRWLQGKLNQRSVPCRLHGHKETEEPYEIFDSLMNNSKFERGMCVHRLAVAASDEQIQKRLLERVGPTDFEFLVRDLMICEQPDLLWETGGKLADGGVDVAGFDRQSMRPKVLIQCKWQWNGDAIHLSTNNKDILRELFVLLGFDIETKIKGLQSGGVSYRGGEYITDLVRKHAKSVPFLRNIGLG